MSFFIFLPPFYLKIGIDIQYAFYLFAKVPDNIQLPALSFLADSTSPGSGLQIIDQTLCLFDVFFRSFIQLSPQKIFLQILG
jgi:hypothetical protein